ncbi:MAG: hypothetical protein IRY92_05675 [Dactylosporangium sp.]|nr:hypothetical protein [Dactylosporangium sp.]
MIKQGRAPSTQARRPSRPVNWEEPANMDGRDQRGVAAAGAGVAGIEAAGVLASEAQFGVPGGHGFAAENANHLLDIFRGRKAKLVGYDNAAHGADRWVDGGFIQSKFAGTAYVTVDLCFDEHTGKFRYWNSDGTPMLIEVPRDQYDEVIRLMRVRISRGQVEGITDPDAAEQIIKKSPFTYRQVRNIARAGTVESVVYDSVNGAYVATTALGISAGIRFAQGLWSGESTNRALREAFATGVKTFGVSFVAHVLAAQLAKAGLHQALRASSERAVRLLGARATAFLVNGVRNSKNIYGAAALSSGARILRGNIIINAATFVVLSMVDFTDIARRRISPKQLLINLTGTAAGLGGGAAGAVAGAAVGSAVPGPGTVVGGVAGFLFGATAGHFATRAVHALIGLKLATDHDDMTAIVTEVLGARAAA